MKNLSEIKNLIFDIDGTIWDSTPNVALAFNEIIKSNPSTQDYPPLTADILKKEFGKPLPDIGRSLFPSLPEDEMLELLDRMMAHENKYLKQHQFEAYEGLKETFIQLSKTHKLFIVSNCQAGYIELCIENLGLEPYITDHLCPGDSNLLKADNIRLIIERNHLDAAAYIGDIAADQKASIEAGVPFIWASYGFGHVEGADAVIKKPSDLLTIFN